MTTRERTRNKSKLELRQMASDKSEAKWKEEEKKENNKFSLIRPSSVAFLYGLSVFLVDFYHNTVIY